MSVRRALNVERTPHLEVAPFVIERAHLRRIDVLAGFLVFEDGPLVPRIPQALHDIEEFAGNLVAFAVLVVALHAEVARGVVAATGHDVPGDATLAQMLQRLEGARDGERLAEAGRDRGAEADMPRHEAQGRDC